MILGRPFAAFSDDRLFIPLRPGASLQLNETGSADSAAIRTRPVRLNHQAISPDVRTIRLNLFDDLQLTADRERVDLSVTGGYVWVGQVREQPGTVTLALQNGILAGSVELDRARRMTVNTLAGTVDDLYLIREIDLHAPEPNGPDILLPSGPVSSAARNASEDTCRENGSVIDVLVTYTISARDAAGGTEAIEALINQLISEMNTANDNSQASFDWRLAGAKEVPYAESGDISTDLTNLQTPDNGLLDYVHAWRDETRADLVAMLVAEGNQNRCGIAYQMTGEHEWFGDWAFGVVALDYPGDAVCPQSILAHELGHMMGNAHDRAHANLSGVYPYSHGYQSLGETSQFRDIMSYDCPGGCSRINHWANPAVFYLGEPTGVDFDTDPDHAADLVRSMDQTRHMAANFRASCEDDPEPADTPLPPPAETPTPDPTLTPTPLPTTSPPLPTAEPSPTPTSINTSPSPNNHHLFLPFAVRP
jgi:peptidyl-Asp metalloendopeptidase